MANITSKASRAKLQPRREPHWSRVRSGLYIGYRKLENGEGTWIARRQSEDGTKQYRSFGSIAGDKSYDRAVKEATKWADGLHHGLENKTVTIEDVCKTYVEDRRIHKSPANAVDTDGRFKRLVYGKKIGRVQLDRLTTAMVRTWLNDQLDHTDAERLRRSKDTANRSLSVLKAALNLSLKDRLVSTDAGWRTVQRFPGVARRRTDFLTLKERKALLDACPDDLCDLVKALLLTGARVGELVKANVADFDQAQGIVRLTGKTGSRTCPLSSDALKLFSKLSKNKLPTAPLLSRSDGLPWHKMAWSRAFREAAKKAGLPPSVVVYSLRHVAISEMIANGVDPFTVAKLAGTSTAMIDKNYGHLRPDRTRERLDAVKMV